MPGMKPTMDEFKHGTLHSGSPAGPLVTNRQQAIAIGLSEARRGQPGDMGEKPDADEHTKRFRDFFASHLLRATGRRG